MNVIKSVCNGSFSIRFALVVLTTSWYGIAVADTEIHKCTDADGGIVYSQLPCAPEKPDVVEEEQAEDSSAGNAPVADEARLAVEQVNDRPPKSAEELAACKKQYRDQIDAIDAEIQRDYSAEKADDYKQRLLQLTRQLRQC